MGRINENGRTGFGVTENVLLADEGELTASHEISVADEVGRANWLRAETLMGSRDGAGFLGVVNEVTLRVVVRLLADDFDGIFVRSDGAVGTEADEDTAADFGGFQVEIGFITERSAGNVVDDAEGEVVDRLPADKVVEGGFRHARGEVLGAEAVAATDDTGGAGEWRSALGEGGEDVEEKRFADGAGLLGAVENGDGFDGFRQRSEKRLHVERKEETHGENAGFFATGVEPFGGFTQGFDGAAHRDDNALGLGMAVVIEKMIAAAGELAKTLHGFLHDTWQKGIETVYRLAALEVNVGVLRGAVESGVVGCHAAGAEGGEGFFVQQGAKVIVAENRDLGNLV